MARDAYGPEPPPHGCRRRNNVRRFRRQLGRSKIVFVFFSAMFLALWPLLLPVAMVQNRIRERRILQQVSQFVCIACGTRLGAEAMRLADERWRTIVADLHAKSPGMRFRLVRDIDAVCPCCCREYHYLDADRSLVPRAAA
jgi:hypothetical protein